MEKREEWKPGFFHIFKHYKIYQNKVLPFSSHQFLFANASNLDHSRFVIFYAELPHLFAFAAVKIALKIQTDPSKQPSRSSNLDVILIFEPIHQITQIFKTMFKKAFENI